MPIEELLQERLQDNGYDFSAEIRDKFLLYLDTLHRWNQVMNLTAIRNPNEMVMHHILDSLSILPFCKGNRIIDVGTGAGLPGIPLAIVLPDKQFVLLDSIDKKTRFLNQAVADLNLKNVTVVRERAENYHPEKCFDHVVTRALSSLPKMLEFTKHLLCPNGEFLAMKGQYPQDEIAEIAKTFRVIAVEDLKIKGWDHKRCLVRLAYA